MTKLKLKPEWVKTDIPKRIKIKLWRIMKDNPTYKSWEEAIVGKSYTSAQDKLFASDELKYIKMGSDTYRALKYEIMHMPLEEVLSLPADLQSWVKQLRPELESGKYETEVTKMASLSEKYLIDHYGKLHEVLEQFYDQLRTPELSELCLFTLKDSVTVSYSYGEMRVPVIIYEKGAIKLDVEVSDLFLWGCLREHLVVEFPKFDENLSNWKTGVATIVKRCHNLTKTIADEFKERDTKMRWDSAKPYLSPDSKEYGSGVYHDVLTSSAYECVIENYAPQFRQISDSRGLLLLDMECPTERKAVARGGSLLLGQVEQCCLDIVGKKTVKQKVRHLNLAKGEVESLQKSIKQDLRLVLERGTFKGTCSICSDLVAKSG